MKIKWDVSQFDQALQQYVELNKRDLPTIINKVAKDVGLIAAQRTKRAKSYEITALPKEDWWVKYISKKLKEGKGRSLIKKKDRVAGQSKYKQFDSNKAKNGEWHIAAKKLSQSIINRRKSAIGLLASGYSKAANAIEGSSNGIRRGQDAAKGWGTRATITDRPQADLYVAYDVRNREKAKAIAAPMLDVAMKLKTKDLLEYVKRKLAENGAKVSSRKAR